MTIGKIKKGTEMKIVKLISIVFICFGVSFAELDLSSHKSEMLGVSITEDDINDALLAMTSSNVFGYTGTISDEDVAKYRIKVSRAQIDLTTENNNNLYGLSVQIDGKVKIEIDYLKMLFTGTTLSIAPELYVDIDIIKDQDGYKLALIAHNWKSGLGDNLDLGIRKLLDFTSLSIPFITEPIELDALGTLFSDLPASIRDTYAPELTIVNNPATGKKELFVGLKVKTAMPVSLEDNFESFDNVFANIRESAVQDIHVFKKTILDNDIVFQNNRLNIKVFGEQGFFDLNNKNIFLPEGTICLESEKSVTLPYHQLKNELDNTIGLFSDLKTAVENAVSGEVIKVIGHYELPDNIEIPEGVKLIVPEGSTIELGDYEIDVYGVLEATNHVLTRDNISMYDLLEMRNTYHANGFDLSKITSSHNKLIISFAGAGPYSQGAEFQTERAIETITEGETPYSSNNFDDQLYQMAADYVDAQTVAVIGYPWFLLAEENELDDIEVNDTWWGPDREMFVQNIKTALSQMAPESKLVLVGKSMGACILQQVVEKLHEELIDVDLLVMVDPSCSITDQSNMVKTIPSNVKKVYNFRQVSAYPDNDFQNGFAITFSSDTKGFDLVVSDEGNDIGDLMCENTGHDDIDECQWLLSEIDRYIRLTLNGDIMTVVNLLLLD